MKQVILLSIYLLLLTFKNEVVLANESMNVSITPRIYDGADAEMPLHSYTLSLRFRGNYFCAACGISHRDVLSAAHCFIHHPELFPPYLDIAVHSGTFRLQEIGKIHEVERVTIHPGFTGSWDDYMVHDIVHILLKEESKLELGENLRKLNVPKRDALNGRMGTVTGWGCVNVKQMIPAERLQMLQLQVLRIEMCQSVLNLDKKLHKEHLCAYHTLGYAGCDTGDSGGPFAIGNDLVGIQSWSMNNDEGISLAEIFTNVFQEQDFIDSVSLVKRRDEGPDPPPTKDKGMQIKGESSKSKKPGWLRKFSCTSA